MGEREGHVSTDDRIARRFAGLIEQGVKVAATKQGTGRYPVVDSEMFCHWQAGALSALRQVFGADYPHYRLFSERVLGRMLSDTKEGIGILRAAKDDIDGGWLTELSELVAGEVFTGFLDMAGHLLDNGYKDPAASLTGAVLEDSMRRIASKNSIALDPKENLAAQNVKLRQGKVYNMVVWRRVEMWREIRNSADHGRFDEYTKADARQMLDGVRDFLGKYLG
jgi:hypothetical protein